MRITLTQPHTHAGRRYPKGAVLDLPEAKAQWLLALQRATPLESASPPMAKAQKPLMPPKE
jgi:hypothetical protein